jgi:CheY-like chemotaxis protein/HPt (histidine-containing phosphotransfer) domain-containing protein
MSKPIKRTELLNAILTAVVGTSTADTEGQTKSRRRIGRSERSLHLLLTEDNAVNQKLAVRLLEKRGHSVVVANNGKEALGALQGEEFDVVLMDVQMPEMDGFEATEAIRAQERQTGGHIPIVAMTAHAMKGDRERCLEVGMDDYVSKPLQPSDLFEAVEHLAQPTEQKRGKPLTKQKLVSQQEEASIFDRAAAMQIVGGDKDLIREVIDIFLNAECPALMTKICTAIEQGDTESLNRAAHSLKGAASNLAARATVDAAYQLELIGETNDLSAAGPAYDSLEQALMELQRELEGFQNEASV